MKFKFALILFLVFYIKATSQKDLDNINCKLINKDLIIISKDVSDTIYVKAYAKHNIIKQFQMAYALRISYKQSNTNEFSNSIDIDKKNTETDIMGNFIYEIIKECHDQYSRMNYNKEIKRIEKLKQKGIEIYNHYVFIKIYPKL